MKIRHLERADWVKFNEDKFTETVRGFAVEKDGRTIAIAGVLHCSPRLQAFSYSEDEIRKSPKTIVKLGYRVKELLKSYSQDVYAIASENVESSARFLEFLGFEFFVETTQGRLYLWQTP